MRGDARTYGNGSCGIGGGRRLLLVHEPDVCDQVGPALAAHGFAVRVAHTGGEALKLAAGEPPPFAVIALRLSDTSGLRLIAALLRIDAAMRIVMLTGYPSIETAVEAIKLGAVHYLVKPVRAERIVAALFREDGNADVVARDRPMSVRRVAWEYVHHVLQENDGNVSATARALAMDRRTLQRKLRKHPVSA